MTHPELPVVAWLMDTGDDASDAAILKVIGRSDAGLRLATMLRDEVIVGDFQHAILGAVRASVESILKELRTENDHLRAALANSGGECAYCKLPREEWSKCASGFPGCARGDDAMLCPHVGAELASQDQLKELREAAQEASQSEEAASILRELLASSYAVDAELYKPGPYYNEAVDNRHRAAWSRAREWAAKNPGGEHEPSDGVPEGGNDVR